MTVMLVLLDDVRFGYFVIMGIYLTELNQALEKFANCSKTPSLMMIF